MRSVLGVAAALVMSAAASGPVVNTTYGAVRGETIGDVDIFHSIPFAAPPVHELRFKAPQPPTPWTGIKDVSAMPEMCPYLKLDGDLFFGNEDCLYLHVYRPKNIAPDEKLPVMVWIFGGGWSLGDADEFGWYDGTNLATKHNAIIVSMNYRVGPLGFMALDELAQEDSRGALGSMGLQDQRAAMQWAKANVAAFGGDPDQISIFGESAGGFSVCWHLVSPGSKGLFRAGILESGSCDSPQFFRQKQDAIDFGKLYASSIGCSGSGSELLACLRSQNTEHIMKSLLDFFDPNWPFTNSSEAGARALHDARSTMLDSAAARAADRLTRQKTGALRGGKDAHDAARIQYARAALDASPAATMALSSALQFFPAFAPIMAWGAPVDGVDLTDLPLGMMEKGQTNDVPAIFGTNKDEANLFVPALPIVIKGAPLLPTAKSFNETIRHVLAVYDPAKVEAVLPTINNVYSSSSFHDDQWDRVSTAFTDYFFLCGMQRSARAWSKAGNNAFMYRFTRNPGWIDTDLLGDYHTIELDFVWDNEWPPIVHLFDDNDKQLAEQIGEFWTSMARKGYPDGDLNWPLYNGTASYIMQLDAPISLQPSPQRPQCQMWDSVIQYLGPPYYDAGLVRPSGVLGGSPFEHVSQGV